MHNRLRVIRVNLLRFLGLLQEIIPEKNNLESDSTKLVYLVEHYKPGLPYTLLAVESPYLAVYLLF